MIDLFDRRAQPRATAVMPLVREGGRLICPACRHYVGRGEVAPGTDFELMHKCGQLIRLTNARSGAQASRTKR